MRILMIGTSLISANGMSALLSGLLDSEVVTRIHKYDVFSRLAYPLTKDCQKTISIIESEQWDYILLQEMNISPVVSKEAFIKNAVILCKKIHECGSTPVLFSTWAYKENSEKMAEMTISYDMMAAKISTAYHEAAEAGEALVADAGQAFYESAAKINLYEDDGYQPNVNGTSLAAKTIAAVIKTSEKRKLKYVMPDNMPTAFPDDPGLRLFYLYQIFLRYTDPAHPLSTNQIRELMLKNYGISMHRTTLPAEVSLLQAAGIPIHVRRSSVMLYHLERSFLELADMKILVDAVKTSSFITEEKGNQLIQKLVSLTSINNSDSLKRNIHISDKAKYGNEKGYYIVDTINTAINEGRQIAFHYVDDDIDLSQTFENKDVTVTYTVSPYTIEWDGNHFYLIGWHHEKKCVKSFRVDRILSNLKITEENALAGPDCFKDNDILSGFVLVNNTKAIKNVTLVCENAVLKEILEKFGLNTPIKYKNRTHFTAKVKVGITPEFWGWVFQMDGAVKIVAPKKILKAYQERLERACN